MSGSLSQSGDEPKGLKHQQLANFSPLPCSSSAHKKTGPGCGGRGIAVKPGSCVFHNILQATKNYVNKKCQKLFRMLSSGKQRSFLSSATGPSTVVRLCSGLVDYLLYNFFELGKAAFTETIYRTHNLVVAVKQNICGKPNPPPLVRKLLGHSSHPVNQHRI